MPNLLLIAIGLFVACSITHSSAKKDEQKTAAMPNKPDGAMVQGEPSGDAWLAFFLIIVVAVVLAMPR